MITLKFQVGESVRWSAAFLLKHGIPPSSDMFRMKGVAGKDGLINGVLHVEVRWEKENMPLWVSAENLQRLCERGHSG